jgi:hypothetical protein
VRRRGSPGVATVLFHWNSIRTPYKFHTSSIQLRLFFPFTPVGTSAGQRRRAAFTGTTRRGFVLRVEPAMHRRLAAKAPSPLSLRIDAVRTRTAWRITKTAPSEERHGATWNELRNQLSIRRLSRFGWGEHLHRSGQFVDPVHLLLAVGRHLFRGEEAGEDFQLLLQLLPL